MKPVPEGRGVMKGLQAACGRANLSDRPLRWFQLMFKVLKM